MKEISINISINAKAEAVWKVITDIDESINTIKGIEKIEILEKPSDAFVGLKWRETRKMFGQTATEVMWITDAVENKSYSTRAESHGAIYITHFELEQKGDQCELTMTFGAEIVKFMTKVVSALTGWMFVSATKKALLEDLSDIKGTVEKN
jgi:carbon monoxide dehydrogenase subunit G